MSRKDEYYNRAKQEGYRSRAAYKLKQLHSETALFGPGDTVVDLGAAPGGWLQVAAGLVGSEGTVLGVDLQAIEPIDGVKTIRGDLTSEETRTQITNTIGSADSVLSDMAPNMTGEYSLDQARSVYLAEIALDIALDLLRPGGTVAIKVFDGPDVDRLRETIEQEFQYCRTVHPPASRDASSELYLVGVGRTLAPVDVGDTLSVEIEDIGHEGDGVTKIDGYTIFVPNTTEGETVEIEIEDVKSRFAFARMIEE